MSEGRCGSSVSLSPIYEYSLRGHQARCIIPQSHRNPTDIFHVMLDGTLAFEVLVQSSYTGLMHQ